MTDVAALKAEARRKGLARRREAHEAADGGEAALLSSVLEGYRGVPLAGYMAMRTEIDPTPAMAEAARHGPVGVPVILGQGVPLSFRSWTPDSRMVTGEFGAAIPSEGVEIIPRLLIVPLVAFTRAGARLGYGGGFYDRTLELLRASAPTLAVGFAYAAQVTDALPVEPTDQPLDLIVTEREVIELGSLPAPG